MLSDELVCPDMKKISLKSIYNALLWEEDPIKIDEDIYEQAADSLHKMLSITS